MANLVVTDNEALGKLVVEAVHNIDKRRQLETNPVPLLNEAGVRKEIGGALSPLEDSDEVVILRDTAERTHLVIPHVFENPEFWSTHKTQCANLGSLEDFVGHYVLQRCK